MANDCMNDTAIYMLKFLGSPELKRGSGVNKMM